MTKPITPLLAADALIELIDIPGRPIVLIERKNPPYGWAIPGGFVDIGETVEVRASPLWPKIYSHVPSFRAPVASGQMPDV